MDQFDVFFRRADLDHDGRISGAEAVAFFQGSNLPKPVLAQIWQHADQNRAGFLGRQEFYNALKLVTVAQSKRELTPDIVKAALYGPASAKIPAPQINLAALPPAQPNPVAPRPPHQTAVVSSMQPQHFGSPGSVPQYLAAQGKHSMRPSLPTAPSGGLGLTTPNISGDLVGARGVGTPVATSQVPNNAVNSTASSIMTPSASVSVSDSMFGGDVFSATRTSSKPSPSPSPSPMPTQTANTLPASSANFHVTSAPQTPAKIDPLGALKAFTRPVEGPVQSATPVPRPNQRGPIQNLQGPSQPPNLSQPQWPKMTRAGVNKYMKVFMEVDTDRDGKITGEQARSLFLSWRLPREILKQVWDLSDQDNDSMLSLKEFCIALYLMERYREGHNLPPTLPNNVLLDETLLSLTGPPYKPAPFSTPGPAPQQHGMPSAQPMPQPMPHAGLRPPMPFGPQPMQYNQPKGQVASMDTLHARDLSNGGDHNISQEANEAEKVVEDEKVILDSREKMAFYRNKMQDLVLYKSRCENRLNEITERALGDKREAELLAKKYEEKYKQVAEVASKLTIEEASFRDIQERKIELNQALVKIEQGGSADGILQVRADRIQSDLEELLKALAERCKKHGISVKSTAIIELPQGWQPGVPEISAVWDEDWDKFEDEGFQLDVANGKSTNDAENVSPMDKFSEDPYSNADTKSEKPFDTESAYPHSEDESAKSPADSPTTHKIFESPTKDDSFSHFGKNFDAETERSFDDQGWGTFDNNDDVDSVWGFNNDTTKDANHEKHGEGYFFDSTSFTASPRRTDSPHAKSPFGFDESVPGSPASRAATSPRYSVGGAENSFFDNLSRYDSMSTTTHDNNLSRFDSMSSTTQDRNFARFDSMSSSVGGFDHSFDDSDPFGSSGPFKVGKNESDKWAF